MGKSLVEMAADIVQAQSASKSMTQEEIASALQATYKTLQALQMNEQSSSSDEQTKVLATPDLTPDKSIQKNKIICLECGQEFKMLSPKHLASHDLTGRQYRQKYGLKLRQPLCAKALSASRKKAGKDRGIPENLKKSIEAKKLKGTAKSKAAVKKAAGSKKTKKRLRLQVDVTPKADKASPLSDHRHPFIKAALEHRRQGQQFRTLQTVSPVSGAMVEIDGQSVINFSGNDYLGLARHPALIAGAKQYLSRYGAGATASRLVCGSYPCFAELETRLAGLKGTESALIMNSGFQANISLLPALVNRESLVLADRLCHNSINQGILLSRARLLRFRHNDLDHLQELLRDHSQAFSRILIVTESVFSMDGDCCDLDALIEIGRRHQAMLLVDEAHATGVLGAKGMGLACGKDIDLIMGTFGKGLGSYGAYVACSAEMREYLINYCAGFIYSTALPPPVLGAINAALDLVPAMDQERAHLHSLAQYLRDCLHDLGLSTGGSTTQIVPVILGEDHTTLAMSQWLLKQGMLAAAIRPPTVERGRARLRLTLTCQHNTNQVDKLLHAIKTLPNP